MEISPGLDLCFLSNDDQVLKHDSQCCKESKEHFSWRARKSSPILLEVLKTRPPITSKITVVALGRSILEDLKVNCKGGLICYQI